MAGYIPSTPDERQAMAASMGLQSEEELFAHIPASLKVAGELNLPPGMGEADALRSLEALSLRNTRFSTILRGAGAYSHYVPPVVRELASRGEFVTAYTPYQAEMSQGVLQAIFEYQSMVCELLGMDAANASVYDGATAAAEAVLMCAQRGRDTVLLSPLLHPQTREVVETYCKSYGFRVACAREEDGRTILDAGALEGVFCAIVQQPNYYGMIEDAEAFAAQAHEAGARCVMSVNPIAAALLKTPGECGADIAVAEGQPLGLPLAFGGPYLGIMACTQSLTRKLPGRIVGQTHDSEGREAYVLTLQVREQHIKRERASSSICSNEAHCALTASIYMAAMGMQGMTETAERCWANAHALARAICAVDGFTLAHPGEFFHEFVVETAADAYRLDAYLKEHGVLGGLPVDGSHMLWCATENNSKDEIEQAVRLLKEAAR